MQTYPIKRGHYKQVEGVRLKDVMEASFGPVEERDGKFEGSFGALERVVAWAEKASLHVDTVMNPNVDDETAIRTRQAWNAFLERATGFDTKARKKRAEKAAKAADVPDV